MPDWNVVDHRRQLGERHARTARAYWMNACMSPTLIAPLDDLQAADDRDQDVLDVAHEHRQRLDQARR